jgi:hypothetical protein
MNNIEKIKSLLTSKFELDLFEASLASLNEKNNKLRYNNFSYSIRELSRHFLHKLAPDVNVKNCSWYKKESNNGEPTRTQRIKYAIQGGVEDKILEKWGFEIDKLKEIIKLVKSTIDSLSKYTHINPDVFDLKDVEVEQQSKDVLYAFESFVKTIEKYSNQLTTFLDGKIEEQITFSQSFINIDCLAPHYSLNGGEVSDYHVVKITDHEIIVSVNGYIYVTLEYGSRQERREGDGLDLNESFPFETIVRYEIDEEFPLNSYEVEEFDADTSKWYEEGGDIE